MAVYNVQNASVISFISGRDGFLVCDSADFGNDFAFNLGAHAADLGFADFGKLDRVALQNIGVLQDSARSIYRGFVMHNNSVVKILTDEPHFKFVRKLTVDYLILTSRCKLRPQQVFDMYNTRYLIVDSSVSFYVGSGFEKFFAAQGAVCHNVRKFGAFLTSDE